MALSYCFITLRFTALKPITHVPHFQGGLWSALFRYAYNPFLNKGEEYHQLGIALTPADTGVLAYATGDLIEVGVGFPAQEERRMMAVVSAMETLHDTHGHFAPGNTIGLESAFCRRCVRPWPEKPACPLTEADIRPTAERLSTRNSFQLCFISPLRIKRPEGKKEPGHNHCDEAYFRNDPEALSHLFSYMWKRAPQATPRVLFNLNTLRLNLVHGMWYDMNYGRDQIGLSGQDKKVIGGFSGVIGVSGQLPLEAAAAFIFNQWLGVGPKKTFGFGQYIIPEIQPCAHLAPLLTHTSLLKAALDPDQLNQLLEKMEPSASCGPDGVTVAEWKKVGRQGVNRLIQSVQTGAYHPGATQPYRIPKKGGDFREIQIANVGDMLLQKSAAKVLTPVIDRMLSDSSFAYRENYGRHRAFQAYQAAYRQGFRYGVKADIASFFDSVDRFRLLCLLSALFPNEPLIPYIFRWIQHAQSGTGLPQGNPLSPVLSNLFLDQFDRMVLEQEYKLIRYSDDFLLLFKHQDAYVGALTFLEKALAHLGLKLATEKTQGITPHHPITFLGYRILGGEEAPEETERIPDLSFGRWLPLFIPGWEKGKTIYITSRVRQSYNEKNTLTLELEDGTRAAIPWATIDTIVVIGKQRLSGGVLTRALKDEVPVFFQYFNGMPYGALLPEKMAFRANIMALQEKRFQDEGYALSWARQLVIAMVHNRSVLLKGYHIKCLPSLPQIRLRVNACKSAEELRGVEGSLSRIYFQAFANLVSPFTFDGRCYHPPDGPVNAMLSLGYTLLYHRLNAALIRKGLDTRTGFFHKGRGTHAALVSDLMEELRFLVDRIVLTAIRLKTINLGDFAASREDGPLDRLVDKGFSAFISRFEKSMGTLFQSDQHKNMIDYNTYLDEMADKVCGSIKLGLIYEPRMIR